MDTKPFKPGSPIIIGLCGKAGTGKTTVADILSPMGAYIPEDSIGAEWDHLFFARPLYEMATIRRKIQGHKSKERQLYEIHGVLVDLFSGTPLYGAPDYDDLINLTKSIVDMPIEMDEDTKPRSFLQDVGTMCRSYDPDCFVKWVKKMVNRRGADVWDRGRNYVCVVSDIRMPNEAKMIYDAPNGVVIRFDASKDIREARLLKRDGYLMSLSQASHVSENIEAIGEEYITATLDTDSMDPQGQAIHTKQIVYDALENLSSVKFAETDVPSLAFAGNGGQTLGEAQ